MTLRFVTCVFAASPLLSAALANPSPLPAGVVVESVQRGFAADVAGVREGDVLLAWSRVDAIGSSSQGEVRSPLLLVDVEFGQLPRGTVVLTGTRGGAAFSVQVPPDAVGLGLTARPWLGADVLDLYVRGRTLVDEGHVEEGTRLWREAAERARLDEEALARCWLLARVGNALALAKRGDPAREAYDEAVACAEREDARAVATVLEWRGEQEFELGEPEAALAAFQMAVELRDAHPDSVPLSSIDSHFNVAIVQRALGRKPEAAATLSAMRDLVAKGAPESLLAARVLLQLGQLQYDAGDLDEAGSAWRRAESLAERALPRSSTWARTQTVLGTLAGARGDLAAMEQRWRRAMEYQVGASPDSVDAGRALLNMSAVAVERGDLPSGRHWAEAALRVLEPLPVGRNLRAAALNNLGRAALLQGDTDEALRAFERVVADVRALSPGSWTVPIAELNLSEARSARGELAAARAHADAAVEAAGRSSPGTLTFASALIARGELARREGEWHVAQDCFERTLATLESLGAADHVMATHALQGLASILRREGNIEAAARHLRRAVSLLDAKRSRVGRSDEERSLFASSFHGVYRDLVDLLAEEGRTAEAFEVLEASRARSLLSMLAMRDLSFDHDVPPEVERERRAVDAEYERVALQLKRLAGGGSEAATLRQKLAELRESQVRLDEGVRLASPRLASLRDPQPQDVAGVAAHLDPGTLFVAYSVGAERTVAFTLTSGQASLQHHFVPVGEEALRRRVDEWRRQAQASPPGPRFRAQARELHDLLLGPLSGFVDAARRIVVSADGPLHALPFAALRDARGFLVERKALVQVPSGTVYAQQVATRASRGWGAPAAFGDPQYQAGSFPELPGSRREVSAVASVYSNTRTYVGSQATEERVKSLKGDNRFVHFAVHGLIDTRSPLDSALVLSTPGRAAAEGDNGLLYAWEIFERVRLDADLVALSACDSAAGTDRPGEGLVGLTRAFVYAGARSVLASLWNVGDASTGPFMKTFYQRWAAGDSKAEALRKAQVDAIRRGQRPLRWAAFQLYGDDR